MSKVEALKKKIELVEKQKNGLAWLDYSADAHIVQAQMCFMGLIGEELEEEDQSQMTKNIEPTNLDRGDFKMHIFKLLKLGVIRKSDSPHRSAAFIVRNHYQIVRGKSQMVINYKRVNDNTVDDAYNIPHKTVLINQIQNCKIFSKFDLKCGFWQVKMHPNNIKWTAFTCPEGHFEWLVMHLGLKTLLVFFKKKWKTFLTSIAVFFFKDYIDFLGVNIGEGKIKLQPHNAQKALDFLDKLEDLKQLQKFLGVINYARPFIKNLGKIAGPLYAKTSPNWQKKFN
ncbi:hypothetical protein OSB04_024182 [Centaurea solstitialis]|uniref:Reverse transcriptase domain-containing protein n=1 Tax=Centaurea solstitialis TaxID=347529 RepID=A0AA38WA41_9ASTR|nr:hypothetical protein OSB04_024182 [Centaurea solstitialis]